jgi:membrane protein DedA with SNARE-associated domain
MVEWIIAVITEAGYGGIVLLMMLENIFPPIPSELIMPFAGFAAARGDLDLAGVVAAGTLGSLLGAVPWWLAGWWLGLDRVRLLAARYGHWMTVSPTDVDKASALFIDYGAPSVFFGRLIPIVRTVISAPAGVVRMNLVTFTLWTSLGTALWSSLLTIAGYLLQSQYERVATVIDPLAKLVLLVIVGAYVYRLIATWRRGADSEA